MWLAFWVSIFLLHMTKLSENWIYSIFPGQETPFCQEKSAWSLSHRSKCIFLFNVLDVDFCIFVFLYFYIRCIWLKIFNLSGWRDSCSSKEADLKSLKQEIKGADRATRPEGGKCQYNPENLTHWKDKEKKTQDTKLKQGIKWAGRATRPMGENANIDQKI